MLDTNYFNSKQSYEASSLSQIGQLSPPPDRHNKFTDGKSIGEEIIVLLLRKPLHYSAQPAVRVGTSPRQILRPRSEIDRIR